MSQPVHAASCAPATLSNLSGGDDAKGRETLW